MSRHVSWWGDHGWYRKPPKKPAPKGGIAVKKFGTTWWGRRWIEALEGISSAWSNRLARGRTYARGGRVHDLELVGGRVRARVTGSRVYRVEIQVAPLGEAAWSQAVKAMAQRAAFAAQLLDGAMPEEIDEAFRAGGSSLFPVQQGALETGCSCPDWSNPCKHVAAVHYVLGEAFDRDPFLLFELRGRGKDAVLAELRQARAGAGAEAPPRRARAAAAAGAPKPGRAAAKRAKPEAAKSQTARSASPSRRKAAPKQVVTAAPERAAEDIDSVVLDASAAQGYERAPAPVGALHFRIEVPPSPGAVLRQLGAPPSWSAGRPIGEVLGPMYAAAGALARELAFGGEGREPIRETTTSEQPAAKRGRRGRQGA